MTQIVKIDEEGEYLIHLEWIPPFSNAQGKAFAIFINNTVIAKVDVNSSSYSIHISEIVADLTVGECLLGMKMTTAPDAVGAHLSHVSLRKMTLLDEEFAAVMDALLLNNFTSSMNAVPGSRIFTYTLTNFLVNFDRLQFYYYHKQNLSYYSEIFLSNINTMQIEKGSITQNLLKSCNDTNFCSSINGIYNNLLEAIDYQQPYTPK